MSATNDTKRRRLPKYQADPVAHRARFGEFRLTERDVRILYLIHTYRYLWVDHIQALLGGVPGEDLYQIPRRLQGLFHNAYVYRLVPMSRMRLEKGSPKTVYTLDTKGAALLEGERQKLSQVLGVSIPPITWRKAYTRRTEFFVEHQVEISTFHAALDVALRGREDLKLLEWRQDAELQASFRYRAADTGEILRAGVKPDAYFAVDERGQRRNFFLEIDRGTEEHRRIREKLQNYYNFLRSGVYQQRYEGRTPDDVRVLVVTTPGDTKTVTVGNPTPASRFERMINTLTTIRGKRSGLAQFWFSTLDSYTLGSPEKILGPIWKLVRLRDGVRHEERRTLFGDRYPSASSS